MKKLSLIIFILSFIFLFSCSTTTQIKSGFQSYGEIEKQINNPELQPKLGDSKEVLQHKKEIIQALKDAQKEIIKQNEANAKLEEEKDKLLPYSGIGKFVWAIIAIIILYFVSKIVKKFVP